MIMQTCLSAIRETNAHISQNKRREYAIRRRCGSSCILSRAGPWISGRIQAGGSRGENAIDRRRPQHDRHHRDHRHHLWIPAR